MCDLSASLKVTTYSTTWACTSSVPVTGICTWAGVTCSGGVVTEILIDMKSLSGTISSSIGVLTSLVTLYLAGNKISGSIPSAIGTLQSLTYLNLGTNILISGKIPSQMGSMVNLKYLYLDNNKLTGTVPSELCNLQKISDFYFHSNSLTCYASCLSTVSVKNFGSYTSCPSYSSSGRYIKT